MPGSTNMQRRHLNSAQRALAGAILLPQLRIEARERQVRKPADFVVPKSEQQNESGRAIVQAGHLAGVGKAYVAAARKMLDKAETDAQAAQALMPYLEAEAKERYEMTVGRPKKSDGNFDQISDNPLADTPTPRGRRHPRAADYAAKLAGVNASTIVTMGVSYDVAERTTGR